MAIAPAFGYEFALDSPAFGGALGATHCLDLPFTFGVADRWAGAGCLADLGDPAIDRVSRLMHRAWAACRTGDPSHEDLAWPTFTTDNRNLMIFDEETRIVAD